MSFHPAASLLLFLLYSMVVATTQKVEWVDVLPLVVVLFARGGQIRQILRQLVIAELFVVFVALGVWGLGGDAALAWLILLRSLLVVGFGLALFGAQGEMRLFFGVQGLGVPHRLAALLFFAIKYIAILQEELGRHQMALRARGFVPCNSLHTYETYARMSGMLLLSSLFRAERLGQALLVRGFRGRIHTLQQFSFAWGDGVLGVAVLMVWAVRL